MTYSSLAGKVAKTCVVPQRYCCIVILTLRGLTVVTQIPSKTKAYDPSKDAYVVSLYWRLLSYVSIAHVQCVKEGEPIISAFVLVSVCRLLFTGPQATRRMILAIVSERIALLYIVAVTHHVEPCKRPHFINPHHYFLAHSHSHHQSSHSHPLHFPYDILPEFHPHRYLPLPNPASLLRPHRRSLPHHPNLV